MNRNKLFPNMLLNEKERSLRLFYAVSRCNGFSLFETGTHKTHFSLHLPHTSKFYHYPVPYLDLIYKIDSKEPCSTMQMSVHPHMQNSQDSSSI